MVDFLYYGEANVNQESLDVFLGLAEELRLKGLTGSPQEVQEAEFKNNASTTEKTIEERKHHVKTTPDVPKPSNVYNTIAYTESSSVALVSVEADQLDEQIKSMMSRTENVITMANRTVKAYACNVCGKEGTQGNIMTHIESNHIASNISHSCDICGKISRSRCGLRLHKAREHLKSTSLQS